MPIHEQNLIRPENIITNDDLEIDGIDVSGHWSTFISQGCYDYNEDIEDEVAHFLVVRKFTGAGSAVPARTLVRLMK